MRQSGLRAALWSGDDGRCIDSLEAVGGRPYFLIGDSHSSLYLYPAKVGARWLAPLHLLCTGASAMGLANPNSKSAYGEKILRWAQSSLGQRIRSGVPVFLKFGQVDAEFVSVFKRLRESSARFSRPEFLKFVQRSVTAYAEFLAQLGHRVGTQNLRVCSTFPPALSDAAWKRGYVNAHIGFLESDQAMSELSEAIRNLQIPHKAERARLHALYNHLLKQTCKSMGIQYVDDFSQFLGEEATIDPRYTARGKGEDHHLDGDAAGPLLASTIARAIG